MVKYCPRCGTPNDDDANFCVKCGYRFPAQQTPQAPPPSGQPQQPYPSKQKSGQDVKTRAAIVTIALIVIFLVGFIVWFATSNQQYSETIVNGELSVNPGYYEYYSFEVPSDATNPQLTISFTASGGSGNDIYVYVMDSTDFINWQNGHSAYTIYNSGKVTTASTTVYLPGPGTYYIVFDNTFSWISTKTVSANIVLQYSAPI